MEEKGLLECWKIRRTKCLENKLRGEAENWKMMEKDEFPVKKRKNAPSKNVYPRICHFSEIVSDIPAIHRLSTGQTFKNTVIPRV